MARMFAEGEFAEPESERAAAARIMATLDEEAAKHGMAVSGDVEIAASTPSPLGLPRLMRLEAAVVPR